MSVAIPRIRDFRGLNPRSFDGRGNYSLGVREQIIFPEVDYDEIDQVRGLDITITTTASTDEEAFALLEAFGMPFSRDGRPQAAASVPGFVDEWGVGMRGPRSERGEDAGCVAQQRCASIRGRSIRDAHGRLSRNTFIYEP